MSNARTFSQLFRVFIALRKYKFWIGSKPVDRL
jgi:hypothetical protein